MIKQFVYSIKNSENLFFNRYNLSINKLIVFKRFAGHSKWQNIRHIKEAKDNERSAVFLKISKQIRIAIQEGGSIDPKNNLQLKQILEQAKRINMPTATIQSCIKSGQNDKSNNNKSYLFEIKGPGGCIILCEVFTNNLHILKQNLATLLRKHKSKFSEGGGCIHVFDRKGVIVADYNENMSFENATDHAIISGAEDVLLIDNQLYFICGVTNLTNVENDLKPFNYNIISVTSEYLPNKTQKLDDENFELYRKLYEKMNNLPEIVKISDNVE